ncbi:hypothetical protein [Elizabethkingia anophelis]|uniref:hypothetical protein n=1 Tax=Elizabethkingia anophelis TaxID=1117645 RepID=UPI00099B0CB5|nr:hypothetical protein [Elizabethkingia anophelis]MDV3876815.1 hypothetical protein [Elizabethkingia anophelis]MDV3968915.1 hypothetical protein [Elizabethkingia anophelis]OPC43183.1 hypothetical protein BAY02_14715 [Elizabethkingia anophelis]QRI50758.1 hypothetical protein JQC76_04465 [Elizabethkingia anophelis]
MKNFKIIKYTVFLIAIISFIAISFITYDLITEEKNRLFKLDFTNKSDIISSYGTLLSSLLSFLSILFVIYALINQKNDQIQKEQKEILNFKKGLLENYRVLIYYLKTLSETLEELNIALKLHIEDEKNNPTITNHLLFQNNKNFSRIIEMDVKSIFVAFQNIYPDKNKERDFVNLYKYIDFYSELYNNVNHDHEQTRKFKYDKLVELSFEILDIYDKKSDMIDGYKDEFPNIYLNKPWVEVANKSILDYYKYIEQCEINQEQCSYDYISSKIFSTFIDSALNLRNTIGYGQHGEQEILRRISKLRKKLSFIRNRVINNAQYLENLRLEYLDESSIHLKEFKELIGQLEKSIQ